MKHICKSLLKSCLAILAASLLEGCGSKGEEFLEQAKEELDKGKQADGARVAELLLTAARKGSPEGMVLTGEMYVDGDWVEPDKETAFAWFRKAAKAGEPDGMFCLAGCYRAGEGTKKENDKAQYWLRKAFESNSRMAMDYARGLPGQIGMEAIKRGVYDNNGVLVYTELEIARIAEIIDIFTYLLGEKKLVGKVDKIAIYDILGDIYKQGIAVQQNGTKAIRYFESGLELGSRHAMEQLGIIYCKGELCPKNYTRGVSLLKEAGMDGLGPWTLQLLGKVYLEPSWEGRDLSQAKSCFEKAIQCRRDHGDESDVLLEDALCGLGEILLFGNPEFHDEKQGREYLERAVQENSDEARYHLALAHCKGMGGLPIPGNAWELLEDAGYVGDKNLAGKIEKLKNEIKSGQYLPFDVEENVVSMWRDTAEAGDPEAQWKLGVCLATGRGTPQNLTEARKWLVEAACQGHGEARAALKHRGWMGLPEWTASDDELLTLNMKAVGGEPAAQRNLGKRYLLGFRANRADFWQDVEVPDGYETRQAIRWLEAGAKSGDAESLYWLAFCTAKGLAGPKDEPEACRMLAEAENRGFAKAREERFRLLGNEGVLRERSVSGDREAQFELGTMLAKRGDAEGIKILGRLANTPHGLKAALWLETYYASRNRQQTINWCYRAAQLGDVDAMRRMTRYKPSQALTWWKRIYERGGGKEAAFAIGRCCENAGNYAEAKHWYLVSGASDDAKRMDDRMNQSTPIIQRLGPHYHGQ